MAAIILYPNVNTQGPLIENEGAQEAGKYLSEQVGRALEQSIIDKTGAENLSMAQKQLIQETADVSARASYYSNEAQRALSELKKYHENGGSPNSNYSQSLQQRVNANTHAANVHVGKIARNVETMNRVIPSSVLKRLGSLADAGAMAQAIASGDQRNIEKTAGSITAGVLGSMAAGSAIGAAVGSPAGGVGAVPAAAIGAIVALAGALVSKAWESFYDWFKDFNFRKFGEEWFLPNVFKFNDWWRDFFNWNRDGKYHIVDPLVLDLDGDGIETVAANRYNGALFDHNKDGIRVATGWVGADDGLLVVDHNGDGIINNGNELFGDSYTLQDGSTAAHGYAALAEFDSNKDGKVDANDADFAQLRVWRDLNQDGVSQANELFTLDAVNVKSLNLAYQNVNQSLGNGNRLVQSGS